MVLHPSVFPRKGGAAETSVLSFYLRRNFMKNYVIVMLLTTLACATEAPSHEGEAMTMQGLCTGGTGNTGCCPGSPIIVDLAGNGINLSSAADGVQWTLNPGVVGKWAWTKPDTDDAFLALDRNANGYIDDGTELFGDGSLQMMTANPNGFLALAYFDQVSQGGNGDGKIDAQDTVWSKLRLWRDANHDAFSQYYELLTLNAVGIHSISLAAVPSTEVDPYGNEFRFKSTIFADSPVGSSIVDAWLVQAPLNPVDAPTDVTEWTCYAWRYAISSDLLPDGHSVACNNTYVQNDPYVTNGNGYLVRLVARFAVDTNQSAALSRAQDIVNNIMLPSDNSGNCQGSTYPVPDTYKAPPYLNMMDSPYASRVKCTSHTTTSNPKPGC